jgi:uncharacterized repeat protein (TIGR02543 family)
MTKSNSAESNSYTLTFKQGTATSTAPSAITNKKYTSYTANGWTTTSGSTSRTYANNTATGALTGNVTLYPCFTQTVNQKAITLPASATKSNTNLGTVTFNYNGSGAAATISTAYTTYAFNGWYTASSGGAKLGNAGASYTPNASIDVYPQFTGTAHSATFPSPTRTGYTFAGWYDAASGGNKVTSYTGSSNTTLYAHWTVNSYQLTYDFNSANDMKAWDYVYKERFNAKFGFVPKVEAIHAGLECGVFADAIKDFDCISVGPKAFDIHTVNERLSISSTAQMYELLLEILRECK